MGSELRRWVPSEVISWQMIAFRCSSLTEWSRAGDDSYLRLTDSREINIYAIFDADATRFGFVQRDEATQNVALPPSSS
nr:hypothetical protein CFP56_21096 [Quercus suber]